MIQMLAPKVKATFAVLTKGLHTRPSTELAATGSGGHCNSGTQPSKKVVPNIVNRPLPKVTADGSAWGGPTVAQSVPLLELKISRYALTTSSWPLPTAKLRTTSGRPPCFRDQSRPFAEANTADGKLEPGVTSSSNTTNIPSP